MYGISLDILLYDTTAMHAFSMRTCAFSKRLQSRFFSFSRSKNQSQNFCCILERDSLVDSIISAIFSEIIFLLINEIHFFLFNFVTYKTYSLWVTTNKYVEIFLGLIHFYFSDLDIDFIINILFIDLFIISKILYRKQKTKSLNNNFIEISLYLI